MNTSKLATLTILAATLSLSSGCQILKHKSAPTPAPDATTAPVAATPAPVKAPKPPVLQDVTIRSMPSGATVVIDGKEVGVTPLVATDLDQAKSYKVSLMLPGYLIVDTTIQAAARVVSGPSGKPGMTSYRPAALPSEVNLRLKADKDPYKALTAAIVDLDGQLKKGKITAAEYQEKTAEVARFYGQAK